jgi:2-iminobutanoate/2-iminopropanoate deaminase
MNHFVNPESVPAPAGPYSTAVITDNGFLFISGQISLDPATGKITGDNAASQAMIILNNIRKIITHFSYTLSDIIKVTIYTTDIAKLSELNEVYSKFFDLHKPARTTVEVKGLPKGALVEIEAVCWQG